MRFENLDGFIEDGRIARADLVLVEVEVDATEHQLLMRGGSRRRRWCWGGGWGGRRGGGRGGGCGWSHEGIKNFMPKNRPVDPADHSAAANSCGIFAGGRMSIIELRDSVACTGANTGSDHAAGDAAIAPI